MKCRAMQNNNIVWFGSYGKNEDGTAKFYDANKNSFSDKQVAVKDSLTQRLSVLKGELWYRVSYGIPLFDKVNSKTLIDTFVISTITDNKEVVRIENFESSLRNHNYTCNMKIITSYGDLILQI